jgi:ABC-type multidrug transport system fused ATPase/permease subunit
VLLNYQSVQVGGSLVWVINVTRDSNLSTFYSHKSSEVGFWMHTGQRQAAQWRERYLQALLAQDVEFFDKDTNTGSIIQSIATDPQAVQDVIGEKVQ